MGGDVLQLIFSGLAVGGIYALIAVGFVTIYNVNGMINFAQGEFVMVGGMVAASMVSGGSPLWVAALVGIAMSAIIGATVHRVVLYPARFSTEVVLIIITIGVSTTLRGIALLIWGSSPKTLPPILEGKPVAVLNAVIPRQDFFIVGIAIVLMVVLFIFFNKTMLGSALRASMMNREVSRLMGISPKLMGMLSFILGALLAGVVGVMVTPISLGTYNMGLMIGLKGFVAAVIGGLVSVPGAIIGGVLLGVFESLGAGLVSSGYKDAIAFVILLIVLVVRPQGLLGSRSGKRV